MDDTQKQQQVTSNATIFQLGRQPSAAQNVPQQAPFPPPQPPVSGGTGMQKEAEPIPSVVKPVEMIKPTEAPIELSPEVEAAGVKEVPQAPQVTEAAKAAGVSYSSYATPVKTAPTGFVKLPITKEEADAKVKGNFLFKNPSESLLWLAMLIVRQFQMKQKEQQKG